ncbi:diacylglycerol acyltransferase [Pavlovales sp. CCMP2436]|nr:diacylglycerol acyltransferase [Pavlovales sp. CCMP2436]|mmetsp:Transcript_21583/g.53710  ORF Transcript_21583/g.53710 Transcript_21583/m.53710 type:complete len:268 (+) Transcript_21583:171-974(+)
MISYLDDAEINVANKVRTWPSFSKGFWLFTFFRRFYRQHVHVPVGFKETQVILALHPHGCMADYRVILDGQLIELIPSLAGKIRWLAASVLFRLPIVRELTLWTGCVDARRSVAESVLQHGLSIGVLPGGEAEQLRTTHGTESVYLRKRFGFVKLAIRFGVPLVPAYVFGCVDLYYTSTACFALRTALVRKLGVCVPVCYGTWGVPMAPLPVPINVVIGQPLRVTRNPTPSDEEVAAVLEQYICALKALFDANKATYGYAERELLIT